jgi:hypothetical protein
MKIFQKLGFLILLSLATSPLFSESTYTYRVAWFHAGDSDCQMAAKIVAKNFTQSTGHQVLSAGCEKPFPWKEDLVVHYRADSEAHLVSTFNEFSLEQGMYPDQISCETDLSREKLLFTEQTGLLVVTAFCFRKSTRPEVKFPFISRIDGFGNPHLRPFVFDQTIHANSDTNRETLETMLVDSLDQVSSVESPRIRVELARDNTRITIKYYALRKQPLVFDVFSTSESLGFCQSQKGAIGDLMEQFGLLAPKSICTHEVSIDVANQYIFGFMAGPFSLNPAPGSYTTRADCEAAVPKIIDNFRSDSGSSQIEGFCSFEKAEIFSDYSYFVKVLTAI